jgi:hypothetical protein
MATIELSDVSLNIFFEMTFSKKWLSWKKVKFLNIASCHQLLSENHNPPIRDLQKFMEELIMNFPVPPAPSEIQTEANLWILKIRKEYENK